MPKKIKKEISELLNGKKKMGICISKTEPRTGHDVYIFSMYICPVLQKRNSKVDSKSSFQNNTFSKRSSRWCIQSSKWIKSAVMLNIYAMVWYYAIIYTLDHARIVTVQSEVEYYQRNDGKIMKNHVQKPAIWQNGFSQSATSRSEFCKTCESRSCRYVEHI